MSELIEPQRFRKLYINNLNFGTTEMSLKSHFEQWGEVVHCVIKRHPHTGKSKGYGFLTYKRAYMVDDAQAARPHTIDYRVVNSKRAIPRVDSYKTGALSTVNKIYINGIRQDFREKDLREYFNLYGNVVSVNIVKYKRTRKNKGYAFVEFDDYDPVDKIMLSVHVIKGKTVDVRKSKSVEKDNINKKNEMEDVLRDRGPLQDAEVFYIAGYGGGYEEGYGECYYPNYYGNSYLISPEGFVNFGYSNIYQSGGGNWDSNFISSYGRMPVQGYTFYAQRNPGQGSGEYGRP